MEFLFKISNEWTFSKIYYDAEKDVFIDERYHDEYLDTGTICDGQFPIEETELWNRIVKDCNEEGVRKYLKIRGVAPVLTTNEGITFEEFKDQLFSLKDEKSYNPYFLRMIDETMVIYHENNIMGVLSKAEHFWFYIVQEEHGFHTQEEALKYIIDQITRYHNSRYKTKAESSAIMESTPKERSI